MAKSFYFYDLETSGFNAREARIMQFAGQRTDLNLKPIGTADNILVKMTNDILPDVDAVLVHGITPQRTLSEGITESELSKYLTSKVFTPDTIAVGFNNIRFDDEFIRFLFWRDFTDAYEWHWSDGRGRWDLLDVVRMTRALRPDGIKWAFASDGKPSNRLSDVTSINNLDHESAHDALSDVNASLAVARLIRNKQPKLFDYLLGMRDKDKVAALVGSGKPFVYTSGRYPSEFEKTTIAVTIASQPERNAAFVYDLRVDPDKFVNLQPTDLARLWQDYSKEAPYFPVKTLTYNKCPAIAPANVLDTASYQRLKLDIKTVEEHAAKLKKATDFGDRLIRANEIIQPKNQPRIMIDIEEVDSLLYDGFINGPDKTKMSVVRAADADGLADLELDFADERLTKLLPLYKARNFPKSLSQEEQQAWEKFRTQKLMGGAEPRASRFFKRLEELTARNDITPEQQYLLEELQLWGQSVIPFES